MRDMYMFFRKRTFKCQIPLSGILLVLALTFNAFPMPAQNAAEVSPEAKPEITSIQPSTIAAGQPTTVSIEGKNFSLSVYVSFSTPAIRVASVKRLDANHLQLNLAADPSAAAGTVTVYVSNPAGPTAQTTLEITSSGPAQPAVTTPTPQSPATAGNSPRVSSIEPPRAARGAPATLKIKGKNFAPGARVAFSNPGIRVAATRVVKSSELRVDIEVASDAAIGPTSLFVINPDDSEVEASLEIADAGKPTGGKKTSTASSKSKVPDQTFEVINLGSAIAAMQDPTKAKGTLALASGKLKYTEEGKDVFAVPVNEVKEVAPNAMFGINTGTFHIILSSGKTYNFIAATFRPADSQSIVTSLQGALH